ncbi:bifunctional UDP-N-acetylmuramoyl-tripeptide:D-alanyl-D-alanine ligase/alanine racemase [Telluribacter sp.]|jgi:alanine racemase|uniref:bifunctional UDP-N-acetylmuramoyl-tripeptide:D-alanyl-D-alanine ligase/alanine racemase n=1 Tax=Telluribacter sp. TaxID=1978767 RepID=UPI002E11D10B|nr:bifunctional UDP-N-acetylmuramoyl-tripeptide:D-alanyl-D-alanine ligase/alanine racemase [Telluribacter sp.]
MRLIETTPSHIRTSAQHLLTDSRQLSFPEQTLFFAIRGERHDGHLFVADLYQRGVREFVVEQEAVPAALKAEIETWPDATVWAVPSALRALQYLAAQRRAQHTIPVVGITGSNGKTIVKEWLTQLLMPDHYVVASPKSYNSQVGVPLSVWLLNEKHTIALFEAGISRPHEMEYLQPVIQPTVGLFTNIGTAHDEGFRSQKQKITEKLRLFTKADKLIYRKDYTAIDEEVRLILSSVNPGLQTLTWATSAATAGGPSDVQVQLTPGPEGVLIQLMGTLGEHTFTSHFRDEASLENLLHCLVFLLDLGLTPDAIRERIKRLRPVSMRLELKEGINRCYIIDDSYNNDLQGLTMALNFLAQQEHRSHKVVILSDVLQAGQPEQDLYGQIARLLLEKGVQRLIGIGPKMQQNQQLFHLLPASEFYGDTATFLNAFSFPSLTESVVLVKGARSFSFEQIINRLQQKVHGTVLEINLDALTHNLNYYRAKAGPQTRIMVMVKAFAYGSGSAEVANLLQFHRVDYLAVAYADEGVSLRQNGITLPIMVMNPARPTFDTLVQYTLEPELYSRRILTDWLDYLNQHPDNGAAPAVHLKLDTGMHRLGFMENEIDWLLGQLRAQPALEVASVFSHLVGADEGEHNSFSRLQYERFVRGAALIEEALGRPVVKHLLNSAGIVRFPEFRLDMVRVGIGLYGVEATGQEQRFLQSVGTMKTVISQIKPIPAQNTVGYSRRGKLQRDTRLGTLALGYADGYDRRLGNGVGQVWVNGTLCPTVGNVCMDMTMVDLTHASAEEGDEVIVFGKELPLIDLAARIGTIPYELLTGVSERVKRVYFKE